MKFPLTLKSISISSPLLLIANIIINSKHYTFRLFTNLIIKPKISLGILFICHFFPIVYSYSLFIFLLWCLHFVHWSLNTFYYIKNLTLWITCSKYFPDFSFNLFNSQLFCVKKESMVVNYFMWWFMPWLLCWKRFFPHT